MDTALDAWLRSRGGVAHSGAARAAGFSPHAIAKAVSLGRVRRERRSWLLVPDCGAGLEAAARVGGRLTCVSAAPGLGLWVPERPSRHHIAIPHSASITLADAAGGLLHRAAGPVGLPRTEPREHPLNVLFHVARCLPQAQALCVWESALRTGVVDAAVLARVRWRSTRAMALAALAGRLSDSGIETEFVTLMRRAGVAVRQQVWVDGHPLDGLVGERLGIQLDGFAHHRADQRRRDLRADARLVLRGYTVLRFDYQQIFFDAAYVVDTVVTAMAQGLHLAGR